MALRDTGVPGAFELFYVVAHNSILQLRDFPAIAEDEESTQQVDSVFRPHVEVKTFECLSVQPSCELVNNVRIIADEKGCSFCARDGILQGPSECR